MLGAKDYCTIKKIKKRYLQIFGLAQHHIVFLGHLYVKKKVIDSYIQRIS